MEKVKVGVVGCGIHGSEHVRTYFEYEGAELVLICDLNEERAKELAGQYRCDYTTNSEEVAGSADIQAVSVTTPDFAHRDVALQMIEAGKHVLIAKPMTTDVKEAKEIVDVATREGVKVMVNFANRWHPQYLQAKEIIRSGRLGKPVMGYMRLSNPLSVPLEKLSWSGRSGPEWFLLPHIVDLARWLLDQEAEEVYASGRKEVLKAKGIEAYDAIQAQVRFSDCFVTFETCWILPNTWPSLIDYQATFFGTEGRISVVGSHQGITLAGERFEYPSAVGRQDAHGRTVGFGPLPIMHFVDCVREDKEPLVTGEDGLAATAIIESIVRSIESGRPVKVPEL